MLQPDPDVSKQPLNDLGWVNRNPLDEKITLLRQRLEQDNGIRGLEILNPDEVERAKRVFYRDGFVVISDVLTADELEKMRAASDRVIHEILSMDKLRQGNRGSHRYSFGGASLTGQQLHHPEWAMLVDLAKLKPILTALFGSPDYIARGAGGDFCLPGACEYQPLHSDMSDRQVFTSDDGRKQFTYGSFLDPRGQLTYRDLPCPYICCNFLMVDFTAVNGPTRQIPGTQHSHEPIPSLDEEPSWMKLSTVCPAPAGSVLIRDVRAWHGGTPNLSNEVRAIPNAEYYAPWFREELTPSIPPEIYADLSAHGKQICRYILADENLKTGYRKSLGGTPESSRARSE